VSVSARLFLQSWGTFAVAFVPGEDAVLYAVANQRIIDAHVTVAKERTAHTGS